MLTTTKPNKQTNKQKTPLLGAEGHLVFDSHTPLGLEDRKDVVKNVPHREEHPFSVGSRMRGKENLKPFKI